MQYYLFLHKEGPFCFVCSLLQRLVYTSIYMACFTQVFTGLSLYAIMDQSNQFFQLLAMSARWVGIDYFRLIHTIIVYLIWLLAIVHVHLVIRSNTVHNHGDLSSITGDSV